MDHLSVLAHQAGIPIPTLSRHVRVFRRYASDPAVLLCRCTRPDRPRHGGYLLLLTRTQLVVTREAWLTRRPRLDLAVPVERLRRITWTTDPDAALVELAVGTDHGRERFWLRALYARQVWRLDAALGQIFQQSPERERLAEVLTPV